MHTPPFFTMFTHPRWLQILCFLGASCSRWHGVGGTPLSKNPGRTLPIGWSTDGTPPCGGPPPHPPRRRRSRRGTLRPAEHRRLPASTGDTASPASTLWSWPQRSRNAPREGYPVPRGSLGRGRFFYLAVHAPTISAYGVASQDPARLPRRAARVRRALPRHVACGAALGGGAGAASSATSSFMTRTRSTTTRSSSTMRTPSSPVHKMRHGCVSCLASAEN